MSFSFGSDSKQGSGSAWAGVMVKFLCLLPLLELLALSFSLDAYQRSLLASEGLFSQLLAHAGALAKFLVLATVLLLFVFRTRGQRPPAALKLSFSPRRCAVFLPCHLISFAVFFYCCVQIFSAHNTALLIQLMWVLFGLASALFWLMLWASAHTWLLLLKYFRGTALLVLGSSLVIWALAQGSADLWGPLSDWTFSVSSTLLYLVNPAAVYADFDGKILGFGGFLVHVAPACSGYEGIGLAVGFTAVYVYAYAQELRFPRVLVLFPIAALLVWLLNCVRIALLILMGAYGSADVAVGGFHSQAGWLSFIATSLLVLYLAHGLAFFQKAGRAKTHSAAQIENSAESGADNKGGVRANIAIACLLPMVSLLAMMMLSSIFITDFDWLYPWRALFLLLVLVWCWPAFGGVLNRFSVQWPTILVALAVTVLWVCLSPSNIEADNVIQQGYTALSFGEQLFWWAFRFLGAVILIPIAEELAFRAYMMSRLAGVTLHLDKKQSYSVISIVISSLAFGFLHQAWFAGLLAGLAYAFIRLRYASIVQPIIAHALTNFLVFVFAAYTQQWSLL